MKFKCPRITEHSRLYTWEFSGSLVVKTQTKKKKKDYIQSGPKLPFHTCLPFLPFKPLLSSQNGFLIVLQYILSQCLHLHFCWCSSILLKYPLTSSNPNHPSRFSSNKISCFLDLHHSPHSPTCMLSHVQLFPTPWTIACQAPLSMEFSRHEYWSGLPFPSPQSDSQTPNPDPPFVPFIR